MPYISQQRRELIAVPEPRQGTERTLNAGELTYLLTVCLEQYRADHGDRYQTFAEIVGALEQAKDEFQRRVIHPYEDGKCSANGDCYANGGRSCEYIPGVNCIHCGRFVGRDGHLNREYFEMTNTLASLDGECRACLDAREDGAHG